MRPSELKRDSREELEAAAAEVADAFIKLDQLEKATNYNYDDPEVHEARCDVLAAAETLKDVVVKRAKERGKRCRK